MELITDIQIIPVQMNEINTKQKRNGIDRSYELSVTKKHNNIDMQRKQHNYIELKSSGYSKCKRLHELTNTLNS